MAQFSIRMQYVNRCVTCHLVRNSPAANRSACSSSDGEHYWGPSAAWQSFVTVERIAVRGWDARGFAPQWAPV